VPIVSRGCAATGPPVSPRRGTSRNQTRRRFRGLRTTEGAKRKQRYCLAAMLLPLLTEEALPRPETTVSGLTLISRSQLHERRSKWRKMWRHLRTPLQGVSSWERSVARDALPGPSSRSTSQVCSRTRARTREWGFGEGQVGCTSLPHLEIISDKYSGRVRLC